MKHPQDCESIEDVRQAIDALDREIVRLIGQRSRYVEVAVKFKTSEAAVRAPERQRAMLAQRRLWAEQESLSPDVIESLYENLIDYFINRESKVWKSTK